MEINTKSTQTIFNEKFARITYDPAKKVIISKWIGFLKLDDLKKGFEAMDKQIRTEKVALHISDQTELKVLAKEVQEYIATVWMNDVEKIGLRKIAILVADDVFAQASVSKVNTSAQIRNLKIQTFNSLEKCYTWLNEATQ